MARLSSDISMSPDGFVTGPNEGVGNPLGDDGDRLHDWMSAPRPMLMPKSSTRSTRQRERS
jgi:hypothetical protein